MKTASRNYYKNFERDETVGSKVMALFTCYSGLAPQGLLFDSIGTTRKTSFGNYCKTLSAIKRSDQKLWPFSAFILVWGDMTSSSTSRESIGTTRETTSRNYSKKYERDPTVGSKFMALFSCYSGLA
jgi:hypothetical protein